MPFKLLLNAAHPQWMPSTAARNENLQCYTQTQVWSGNKKKMKNLKAYVVMTITYSRETYEN